MSKKLVAHLQYSWWKYLALIVVVVLGWLYVFMMLARPQANEQLNVAIFDDKVNPLTLKNAVADNQPQITKQYLEQISFEAIEQNEPNLNAIMDDRTQFCDFVIIAESLLKEQINMHTYSRRIPLDKLRELWGEVVDSLEFFLIDYDDGNPDHMGMQFGIYLNNPNDGVTNNFEKHYTGTERCVLFFGFKSVNLNQLYGLGNAGDSAGLDLVLYLLKEAK